MSQASSAASQFSVNFQGQEMSLEQALDETIRGVQNNLNSLQCALRNLAAVEEQAVDTDEDFKNAVELEDQTVDLVDGLVSLLEELPRIAAEIRGKCPPALKQWYADHKVRRKDEKLRAKQEAKAAAAAKLLEPLAE